MEHTGEPAIMENGPTAFARLAVSLKSWSGRRVSMEAALS